MPFRAALEKFNKANGYKIDGEWLNRYFTSLVRNRPDPNEGLERARNYIKTRIADERYERVRQEMRLKSLAKPGNKKLSDQVNKMTSFSGFVYGYVDAVNIMITNISSKSNHPYNQPKYLGFTGQEFADLVRSQLNTYSYLEGRYYEVFKAHGIQNPRFIEEAGALQTLADNNVTYETANAEEKGKIHAVYATKMLTEQRLARHGWLWKWWYGKETQAMEAYVKKANEMLAGVKFPEETPKEYEDFAKQGYALSDPAQKALVEEKLNDVIQNVETQNLKEANEKLAKQQEEENKKIERQQARVDKIKKQLEAVQPEVDAVNQKPLHDRFFDIRFRPPFDREEYNKQYDAFKAFGETLHGKNVPPIAKHIFKQNAAKFMTMKSDMRNANLSKEELDRKIIDWSKSFLDKEAALKADYKTYNGLTEAELNEYDRKAKAAEQTEVKENTDVKEPVDTEQLEKDVIGNENAPTELSQKHEAPSLSKEAIVKDTL